MPLVSVDRLNRSLRAFWRTFVILNLSLAAAGVIYASCHEISAAIAIPVVLAFLFQASVYLVPGFPQLRRALEERFTAKRLAAIALASSLAPYLIYSIPTGVFSLSGLVKLSLLCGLICLPFLLASPRDDRLGWQDVVVLAALAYPMISGLTPMLREIYLEPVPEIPRLDVLGKIMLIPLGAMMFLSIRKLPATGYRFAVSRGDLKTGVSNYLLFVPVGAALAIGTGFLQWRPQPVDGWTYVPELLGNMLGVYAVVALGEELYFRGILQNLLARRLGNDGLAHVMASVLFGLAHLSNRGFPNWQYACVAAIAGWFYGRAYRQRKSVVAAAVTHTLVVVSWRFLFE